MNFRYLYFTILCLMFTFTIHSQELNLSVSVQIPQLQTADPRVFKTLEKEIEEFMNTTKWTNDEFLPEERIEGNLTLVITNEISAQSFTADILIQSIRPIFNSNSRTKLLNHKDVGITFGYLENQPIRNSKDRYFDNLSTVLTFYAYLMIGLDYDTFSKLGGQQYFTIINNMISGLPSNVATSSGWDPAAGANKRNRYWMLENIFNPRLRTMRESLYAYHRHGLDVMSEDPGKGKAVVLSSLKTIEKANDSYPNSMFIQMFSDAKYDEIVEIFLPADRVERNQVYDIMVAIDPFRAGKFTPLRR